MWTPNYEDIKGVQGASGKTKIVKRQFQVQEDAWTTPEDENCIEGSGYAAAAPAAGAAEDAPPAGGRSLQLLLLWLLLLRLRRLLPPPVHQESRQDRARRVVEADVD